MMRTVRLRMTPVNRYTDCNIADLSTINAVGSRDTIVLRVK
jgi:hypothetical protein